MRSLQKSKKANSNGSSLWNVKSSSTSTTPIVEKIDKIERLIIDGKVTFVDDEVKPLERLILWVIMIVRMKLNQLITKWQVFWLQRRLAMSPLINQERSAGILWNMTSREIERKIVGNDDLLHDRMKKFNLVPPVTQVFQNKPLWLVTENLHKSAYLCTPEWQDSASKIAIKYHDTTLFYRHCYSVPLEPLSKPTNILERPSASAPRNPMVNPIITQEQTWTYAHGIPLANPTSNLKGSSPGYPLADPANMLKHMSSCNSLARSKDVLPGPSSMPPLANPAYTLKHPSGLAPRCVGANPTETLIGGPTRGAPHNSFFDPEETLIGGATRGAPHNSFFDPEETLIGGPTRGAPHNSFFDPEEYPKVASLRNLNQPLENYTKPHGKSSLGVRYESMIHKVWDQYRRLGHTDVPLKDVLAVIGLKQVMEVKIRVGANNRIVDLINLLTATGSTSSLESQPGSSSEAHEDLSQGGIGKMSLFPVTPAQVIHNHHSVRPSQGLVPQMDNHEEGADLDLKL
ncbi:hypothetical protein Tco_0688555 [Tanacetum coccineum]